MAKGVFSDFLSNKIRVPNSTQQRINMKLRRGNTIEWDDEHTMHVYLRDGNQRRWITDVYLLKGYCPCIGGDVSTKVLSDVLRMEPAIWCKVLFLESVSVDCNQRMICWTTSSRENNAEATNGSPNQYSINDECSGYDADDELFDLARTIINKSAYLPDKDSNIQDTDDDYELSILRMLHCFILPKISLQIGDMEKVMQAKEKQGQHIQALDHKVIEQCQIMDDVQNNMDQLLGNLLPNIEEMTENNQCSKHLLECLSHDINSRESKLRNLIDRAQNEVEALKTQLSGGNMAPDLPELLQQARKNRDDLQVKLLAVLTAREDIADAEGVVNNDLDPCDNQVAKEYLEERDVLQRMKDDRNIILEQKNCALSVREMLDGIINDLRSKGFSQANDADSQGSRATDVLQGVWYPEWQKLGERVATIVNNEDHPIGMNFQTFCPEIREMCQDLIELGKRDSLSPMRSSEYSPFEDLQANGLMDSPAETYGLQDFIVESYRERIKALRVKLFAHFNNVTELLSETFNSKDYQFKNRLRLAYEQCFYDKEGSFVECVYELAHHQHVAKLETDVKRLKQLPIKLLKLPMKDEWWLDIFEQRVRIGSLSDHIVRSSPEESISINGVVDGARRSSRPIDISGSYDIIDDFEDEFPQVTQESLKKLSDCKSVRSFFISHVRDRSRTFNFEDSLSSDDEDDLGCDYADCAKPNEIKHSASAPELKFSLHHLINNWEKKRASLKRQRSKSQSYMNARVSTNSDSSGADTFEDHFGPALENIRDILKAKSPLAKLKCLTASLRKITDKVAELRLREGGDQFSVAVTAEDLLPLLILMMLQMEPYEAAVLWPQLAMAEDLMPPFLSSGCHGWALVEFQMAQRILTDLCTQF